MPDSGAQELGAAAPRPPAAAVERWRRCCCRCCCGLVQPATKQQLRGCHSCFLPLPLLHTAAAASLPLYTSVKIHVCRNICVYTYACVLLLVGALVRGRSQVSHLPSVGSRRCWLLVFFPLCVTIFYYYFFGAKVLLVSGLGHEGEEREGWLGGWGIFFLL